MNVTRCDPPKLQRIYVFFCEPALGLFGSSVCLLSYHTLVWSFSLVLRPSFLLFPFFPHGKGRSGVVGQLQISTILNWALVRAYYTLFCVTTAAAAAFRGNYANSL